MEITFKDIVKLIHPDTNPSIQDASGKMSLVIKHKTNTLTLWNLALKWGLVKGEYNISSPECPTPITTRPNTGWGYNRTNPSWTPSKNTGWDVNNFNIPTPPRQRTTRPKLYKVYDIVKTLDNGIEVEGVVMKITPVLSKYHVEILTGNRIIVKVVSNLRHGEIVKRLNKASKKRINDSQFCYDLLKRG